MTNTDQVLTVAPQVRFSVNFPFLEPLTMSSLRVGLTFIRVLCLTRSVFQVYSCVYETKRGTMKNNENVRTETVAIWLQEQEEQESNEEQTKPHVLLSANVAMWLQEEHEQENSEEQAKPQVLLIMYW